MRKVVRWMAGLAGIAALAKLLRARPRTVPALTETEPDLGDPAEELRRKLAEARAVAPDLPEEPEEPASPAATPDETERSLEERRADIHARAQDAIDAMRKDDT